MRTIGGVVMIKKEQIFELLHALWAKNAKIAAIKNVRAIFDCGLLEAKIFTELLCAGQSRRTHYKLIWQDDTMFWTPIDFIDDEVIYGEGKTSLGLMTGGKFSLVNRNLPDFLEKDTQVLEIIGNMFAAESIK